MQEKSGSIKMLQELKSESFAFARSLNQTWSILEYERGSFMIHHSEIGDECRKWIVSNLWPDIGDLRDESRLSGIWQTDDPDVSNELEL